MITFIARALRLIPLPPVVKEATERIAFTFKGNVFVMEADGDNQQQLAFNDRKATNTNCCPIWLSDDKRVAFTRYHFPRDGDWDVFTMGADGGNQQRVGGNPYDYNDPESNNLWFKPALSPYGNRIAFAGYRGGDYEIFVMDAASGDLKQLTQNSRHVIEPVWSPDGARIAFTRSGEGIFVMDADGGNQTRLQGGDSPVWLPDGARIALRGNLGNSSEIFVVDTDGNNSLNLTNDHYWDDSPAWSPDGSQIAFRTVRDGSFEIFVMDADGNNSLNLTNDPGADGPPAWSTDGTRIAFTRHDSSAATGDGEIFVMDADGSNIQQLAEGQQPVWLPKH